MYAYAFQEAGGKCQGSFLQRGQAWSRWGVTAIALSSSPAIAFNGNGLRLSLTVFGGSSCHPRLRLLLVPSSSGPSYDSGILRCLWWVMLHAGIVAPPISTRAMSVSDAFARGEDFAKVLHTGDWSRTRAFYLHYLQANAARDREA